MQKNYNINFYVPSNVIVETIPYDPNDPNDLFGQIFLNKPPPQEVTPIQYFQEVDTMLATILETKREMESTGQELINSTFQ